MLEKDFQSDMARRKKPNGVHELKLIKPRTRDAKKSFPFSDIRVRQMRELVNTNGEEGYYHKLSDIDRSTKGFDCFFLQKTPAYLVVMYWYPRVFKNVYYIHVQDLLKLIERNAPKKSATEDELLKHSTFIDDYTEKNKFKQLKDVPKWRNVPQEEYIRITKDIKFHQ